MIKIENYQNIELSFISLPLKQFEINVINASVIHVFDLYLSFAMRDNDNRPITSILARAPSLIRCLERLLVRSFVRNKMN